MHKTVTATLILATMVITFVACSNNTEITKSVSYQGDIMYIKVKKVINGKKLTDFDQQYDVAGLSKAEREDKAQQIMDSLDINTPGKDETGK